MYRRTLTALAVSLGLLTLASSALAEVRLPHIFGEHMVLQREKPLPVWGWAEPGEEVTVTLGDNTATATADDQGHWQVELPAMEAGGPYTLVAEGSNKIELADVLIGEVWLCSGQSNMEWHVVSCTNADEEIANSDHPGIRMIKVSNATAGVPQDDFNGAWAVAGPDTTGSFSAAGYYFGRKLHEELGVPVGLINSSWGGSRIEPWTPEFAFSQQDALEMVTRDVEAAQSAYKEQAAAALDALEVTDENRDLIEEARTALANNEPLPAIPGFTPPAHGLNAYHMPTSMYNAMIHPLEPYALRGAIWYQGESNNGEGMLYRDKMQALIDGWRQTFDQGDFPFYYVQLAPFAGYNDGNLEGIWEAQVAALDIPNTGMAVTTDIVHNLGDIHPQNKQDVGLRLALWALAHDYGQEDLVFSGPIFSGSTIEGDKIRVSFEHVGGGLASRDDGPLNWFQIGDGERFVDAVAEIDGDTIVVSSPEIAEPVAVRFAWNRTAVANLVNAEGLPASPFRSDCAKPYIDGGRLFTDSKEVSILSRSGAGEIRYTTDGSTPTAESTLYEGPFEIKDTTTVLARSFDMLGRSSLAAEATFEKIDSVTVDGKKLLPGVSYAYYEGDWQALPDFSTLEPVHEGDLDTISLDGRKLDDQYALVFNGYLRINEEGDYKFFLRSDDGSRLSIDGNELIVIDGVHPPTDGTSEPVHLTEGLHPFEIEYFEWKGGEEISVEFEGPGVSRMNMSDAVLREE